jgi:hypothetical protein
VSAVPRFGWGALAADGRRIESPPASVYVLNRLDSPVRGRLSLKARQSLGFSLLRVRLGSYVLAEIPLTSENSFHTIDLEQLFIPTGGHHLFFEVIPGGPDVLISNIALEVEAADRTELARRLPFDLYQRYRLSADLAEILAPQSILDVGGYIGDQGGHLAVPADFLRANESEGVSVTVFSTDIRHCDQPQHCPANASSQPFGPETFDLVLSLDVLEHLAIDNRLPYLEELDRLAGKWIIIGAPFQAPEVEEAEIRLSQLLESSFLAEHRELGLPSHELVRSFYAGREGYSVIPFPSGRLARWEEMQMFTQHFFAMNDYRIIQDFNLAYNSHCYPDDQVEPAYRTVYLIAKRPLTNSQTRALDRIRDAGVSAFSGREKMVSDPGFQNLFRRARELSEQRMKVLSDVQFLINERQSYIEVLEKKLTERLGIRLRRFLAKYSKTEDREER